MFFVKEIVKEIDNDLIIDIGNINYLKNLHDEEILSLKNKFEIVQLNERVFVYLMQRFSFNNFMDLYNLLCPRLLVITYGNKGAVFVYDNHVTEKKLENASMEIDPTGAGDAFLSALVKHYYDVDKIIDDSFIDEAFDIATTLTSEVVKHFGARGHIYKKNKIEEKIMILKKEE